MFDFEQFMRPNRRLFSSLSSNLDNFKKLRQVRIDELSLEVTEFVHKPTGALFYHLEHPSADAFSIAFRTLPEDSTGLPHILEHTALCGSKSFPVRDPFFKMLNRSLAVYMNAWTGADFTQYPFVTENSADYDNLRRVYLDAVFNPLLLKDDFLQEGWRLIPSQDDKIQLGGVVYNEMKGALSDSDSFFLTRFQQARFGPQSVYGVVSGGDPMDIPKLTHQDLVDFHRKFYHPSNSISVSSGKQPIEENLRALQDHFSKFTLNKLDLSRLKMKPQSYAAAKRIEITGPIDPLGDPNNQTRLLVSYIANETANVEESFALKILCELLFEGPASPFYKALIDSGLGSEYAPGTGYDTSTNYATISVGLQGLSEDKLKTVEDTIQATFKRVRGNVKEFISPERLETVLHQIELGLRYTSANFGLSLVSSVTQSWIHGTDPISALSIAKNVQRFRERYDKNDGLFESLLDRFILNNEGSKLCFIMRPDTDHPMKLESHEKAFLSNLKLSETELCELKADSDRLKMKQEEEQDLSCLPCLTIDQVNKEIRDLSLKPKENGHVRLYERKTSEANGLVHFKAALQLNNFGDSASEREILLLPIMLQCLTELGGSNRNSAAEFDSAIKRFTGGISFSLHQGHIKYPVLSSDMSLLMSTYGLTRNGEEMLGLLKEALLDCNFKGDQERIKMLISSSASSMSSSIASSGNRFAALKSASLFNSQRLGISEKTGGLSQARFLNDLMGEPVEKVAKELEELRDRLLASGDNFKVALIHSEADESFKTKITDFLRDIGTKNKNIHANQPITHRTDFGSHVFVPGPFSSNFTAMSMMPFKTTPPSARKSALLTLTARLLRSKHLHREIREKGGAYGSAASFSPLSGLFTFSSYRDPSPLTSLNVFKSASKALLARDCPSEEDLLGAKLSAFSDLDAPVDVSSRGLQEFLYGPEMGSDTRRQEYRDALRSCSLKDIQNTLEGVIMPLIGDAKVCVIGEAGKKEEFKNDSSHKWEIEH